MARPKQAKAIEIKAIDIATIEVPIIGKTPLIAHAWSEKAARMMEEKQSKATKTRQREAREPEQEFRAACYLVRGSDPIDSKTIHGFPALPFKHAIRASARHIEGITMTALSGAIFVKCDRETGLTPIYFRELVRRTDPVRLPSGTADLRYRPEYQGWCALLEIEYLSSSYTAEQIVNCVNIGGFCSGIGDWRPGKGGQHGMYEVVTRKVFDEHMKTIGAKLWRSSDLRGMKAA